MTQQSIFNLFIRKQNAHKPHWINLHRTRRHENHKPSTSAKTCQANMPSKTLQPPQPPIVLTPQIAACEHTDPKILWHIAQHLPALRKWVIANPSANAQLLEYIAQQGGPDVNHSIRVLLSSYEYEKQNKQNSLNIRKHTSQPC